MIAVKACENYKYENLKKAIQTTVDLLGGWDAYIKPGERVLLKVNLVMKKRPQEAATSHPDFVKALASLLIAQGAQVIIGDSPGGPFLETSLKSIYKYCEMDRAAKESGAKLNYNTNPVTVSNPSAVFLKDLTVMQLLQQVDKVICVAKLKSHGMTKITAAVKNMFGIIPGTIKAQYHFDCPDISQFSAALVDICQFASPVLSFLDAITAMEGDGPTAGTPRDLGVILAGENPYELDLAAASLIRIDPMTVPTIKESITRNLCPSTASAIVFHGDALDKFAVDDFLLPEICNLHFTGGNSKMLSFLIQHFVQTKPVFDYNTCIGCGDCAKNCPAKTIKMKDHKPHLDLSGCIRCFCCQELCPQKAVKIKRPLLLKLLSKF